MLLAACEHSESPTPSKLPPVPADIQLCFRQSLPEIPLKALTVAEVEALWKIDSIRLVVLQRCGNRLIAWYGQLRARWK